MWMKQAFYIAKTWQAFCGVVNHYEEAKDTYFSHKPLAKSRGNPFPGMNSTVHPNDLLGVIGWLADLEGTSVLYYQTVTYDCKPLCKVIRFLFPFLLHCVVSSMRQGCWQRNTQYDSSSATLALLSVTLAIVFRLTCWVLMSPTKSQIGGVETGLSPWLCYYLAVWPCTSYFTSLGFGFLHYKMKEPKLKIFYDV